MGVSHALERARSAARSPAPAGDRSTPAPRGANDRARPRPSPGGSARPIGTVGAGRHAGGRIPGQGVARARRCNGAPDAHRFNADRAVPTHPLCRRPRCGRAGLDSRQRAPRRRESLRQQRHQRLLLPSAQCGVGARARPRPRCRAGRTRPGDGAGRLRAGPRSLDAVGADRRAVHDDSGAGGDAGEPGRTDAICPWRRDGNRRLSPPNGTMIVRRVACGVLLFALARSVTAQVDPSGAWRTLHTQHFRIHFRPTYREKALEAAREAERAYTLLSTELHPPRGIIDVTLSDDFDTPNGFTTTYPSNRFTIFLVPPVSEPALQTFDSWERLVIVHELTHVFHLDRSRGLWKTLQTVFGRVPGLFPNEYQPSWVIEGLATYYESRFTAGGRAEGSYHRQAVAADAAAGHARSPWDAVYFTRWPDGLAPYAYGSRFWEYLSQTVPSGDSVPPRFTEATAGQLIPFRVGRPLRHVGVPDALTEQWSRAVATAGRAEPATSSRLIAGRLRSEPLARVSPDGRNLAYIYNDGRGAQRLRVVDARDFKVLRSHRTTGQVSFDWLGDTLIIGQLDYTSRWRVRSDLWRWLPRGAWQRMTTDARLIEPRAGGGIVSALELGKGRSVLRLPSTQRIDSSATWGPAVPSPDGRWVVAARHQNGRWALVRWLAPAPTSVTVLAEASDGSAIADPAWSQHGILFVTDAAGFPQIHVWTEAGVTQVTDEPRGARAPAPPRRRPTAALCSRRSGTVGGSCAWSSRGRSHRDRRRRSPSRRSTPRLRLRFEKRATHRGDRCGRISGSQRVPMRALRGASSGWRPREPTPWVAIRITPRL